VDPKNGRRIMVIRGEKVGVRLLEAVVEEYEFRLEPVAAGAG
jgi:hypothetical protein